MSFPVHVCWHMGISEKLLDKRVCCPSLTGSGLLVTAELIRERQLGQGGRMQTSMTTRCSTPAHHAYPKPSTHVRGSVDVALTLNSPTGSRRRGGERGGVEMRAVDLRGVADALEGGKPRGSNGAAGGREPALLASLTWRSGRVKLGDPEACGGKVFVSSVPIQGVGDEAIKGIMSVTGHVDDAYFNSGCCECRR